jgi:DNA gyrase inhibitor GyrI
MPNKLNVEICTIPAMNVVYETYTPDTKPVNQFQAISSCFNQIKEWVSKQGLVPYTLRTIGIPVSNQAGLLYYDCCIEYNGEGNNILRKTLPGGMYAVLKMPKESELISKSISKFYSEYVQANRVQIDHTRPTLEVYTDETMEYCVPVKP